MSAEVESLEKTLQREKEAKYDKSLEIELRNWIESFLEKPFPEPEASFQENLQSGEILCELINKIAPSSVKKINDSRLAFKQIVIHLINWTLIIE